MDITDIKIKKVDGEGKLKAYASITFDDLFVVHNLRIVDGNNGIFVGMPSRKTRSGEFKDIAHPIKSDFRNLIEESVLEAFSNS